MKCFIRYCWISLFTIGLISGGVFAQKNQTEDHTIEKILWTVDVSHDDRFLAYGGTCDTLRIVTVKDRSRVKSIPVQGTITDLDWHPSELKVAMVTQMEPSRSGIYSLESEVWQVLEGMSMAGARAIEWSPNGKYLAIGDNEGTLLIYDAKGQLQKTFKSSQKAITGLSWHPDGDRIVTVGHHIDIVDIPSGSIRSISPRPEEVLMLCVDWHPDGESFVTGDYGDTVKEYPALLKFWTKEGREKKVIEVDSSEYRNIQWTQDGRSLLSASNVLRLWETNSELVYEVKPSVQLWGLAVLSGGRTIITSNEVGQLEHWVVVSNKLRKR